MEVIAPSSTTASDRAASARQSLRRGFAAAVVALFLAGISLPLLGVRIGNHGWDVAAPAENRRLSAEPTLLTLRQSHVHGAKATLKAVAKFPGQFKYYLADHFGFRNLLIRAHGLLMVRGLGVTSNPAVILGKDGWLYLANDGSLEDWRNLDPFKLHDLEQWRELLEARHRYCADRHIAYLFVVAPSKYDVYPEYMPDALTRVGDESRLDQLLKYLHHVGSPVRVLDLRGPLREAKQSGGVRLFQKTDTHWNDRGAWIAYRAMLDEVGRMGLSPAVLSPGDFEPVTVARPGMDLAGLLGLNEYYREESLDLRPKVPLVLPHVNQNDVQPITIDRPGVRLPRVVMFRDSFMTTVLPFVAQSFGRGVYFWEDGFNPTVVEAEKPDLVIQEIAQRKLMQPPGMMRKTQNVRRENGGWVLMDHSFGEGM